VGGGRFVAYQIHAFAEIADFKYENATDSISLIAKPYGPNGGPFTIKLPENSQYQLVAVRIDGRVDQNAIVKGDGKTLTIDVFLPKGDHNVSIQGIQNVPEFSSISIMLVASCFLSIALAIINHHWRRF
jgi:hypothetical protein